MELQVGVKIILQNEEGKYLILHRSKEKYQIGAGGDIPGGRINPGTSLMTNLKREVMEETGLEIKGEPKLVLAQDILNPNKHIVRLTYSGFADGEVTLSEEHSEYRWLTLDEIKSLKQLDSYSREAFEKFLI